MSEFTILAIVDIRCPECHWIMLKNYEEKTMHCTNTGCPLYYKVFSEPRLEATYIGEKK